MKICTNCYYIGQGKPTNFLDGNLIFAFICLLFAGYVFMTRDFSGLAIILIIVPLYFLLRGIHIIIKHERGSIVCPKCSKDKMIELDNPEAIALIETHKLTIPNKTEKEQSA